MRDRFHILAGETCNNRCLFCMEGASRRRHRVTPERIRELLRASVSVGEVMFTSGEPTLNPHLIDFVRWARELGYARIGLTTNGRRLRYEPYARRLLDAGLNHVVVSIHGPNARCHDAQTRSPGSFVHTIGGLETLARLRREQVFTIHTSTVVGRRNVERLGETYWILRAFSVDQCVFNAMQPLFAERLVPSLVAPYGEVVRAFGRLAREVGAGARPAPFLVDVPRCVAERLPSAARGWVECAAFTEYDEHANACERRTRVAKEMENRVKRPECATCRYDESCLGVWRAYVACYGWDEFVPIALAPAGA